jgi:hypothetical protein
MLRRSERAVGARAVALQQEQHEQHAHDPDWTAVDEGWHALQCVMRAFLNMAAI